MEKLKIGISIGDINGIGLEVILKTVANSAITNLCTPVIYGSSKVVSYHKNIAGIDFQYQQSRSAAQLAPDRVNVINCWQDNVNITIGKATEEGGLYAIKSLEGAMEELKSGLLDALVTAPINKYAMQMAGFPFPGHTEYLTKELGHNGESLMLMVHDTLRVGLATNHLPIDSVASAINKAGVLRKIQMLNDSLRKDFGIERPVIAVLGLNPHAGDNGVIGEEEEQYIRPAIEDAKSKGIMAMGPFPADGFFGSSQYTKYDAILAMYHDQGLVPFKLLAFGGGVNYTSGLSGVRTSPDHGTAYDIAGKNEADPSSFREALFLAIDIARNRKDHAEMHANPLTKKRNKLTEGEDEVLPEEAQAV